MGVLLCIIRKKAVSLQKISRKRMKSKFLIGLIGAMALCLMVSCSVRRDRERIDTAEELLYSSRDTAELLIRQVERLERLDDEHLAKYWFVICDLHANSMQSLSEDSMICWASEYYRTQWEEEHGDARHMILSGLDEAMYFWWNGDKARTQEVLQRQKKYADEVAEQSGEHLWQVIVLRVSAEIAMRDYDYEHVREYTETLIGLDNGKAIHLDEVERVYNALAIVYFSLGEYDKMEKCFEKAIAQTADSAFIVNVVRRNYADLLGEIGQTDRAIKMLEDLTEEYRQADSWLQVESLYSLSRLWLNKGDKQRAERYMREVEELFAKYKESAEFDPAAEAAFLAHRQVLEYAQKGSYHCFPLVQYNNHWSEADYVRYRVAEAKERSIRDLRERNLYLTISRQRQMIVIIMLFFVTLGGILLFVYLYRRRQRLLLEKEEEIETLRNMLASADKPDDKESVRKLMLQQLGVIKTIAGTPTEANQQLLARLMALNEETANALIDWPSIYQTIDLVYDGFYTRLVQKYGANDQSNGSAHPVLNEKELQLCCLLKADFSTKEINMLTRQSLQTIYQRKTQVRQKLNLAEGEDITTAII
jgi:tetratricopeptide (TPR) repeat protein